MGNSPSAAVDTAEAVIAAEIACDSSLSSLILSSTNLAKELLKQPTSASAASEELPPTDRKTLASRSSELAHLLLAGVREGGPNKCVTVKRLSEDLAATLADSPEDVKDMTARLAILQIVHAVCKKERRDAEQPYVRPKVNTSLNILASDAEEEAVKDLVLQSLTALMESARAVMSSGSGMQDKTIMRVLSGLQSLFADFDAGSLFADWSPLRLAPEKPLDSKAVDSRRCYSNVGQNAGAAVGAGDTSWKVDKASGDLVWGITFASPQPVSSIQVEWDGGAPRFMQVETTTDAIPDPLRHATRVHASIPGFFTQEDILLTTNELATAAASAAQTIVCSPQPDTGSGSTSSLQVPSTVLPEGASRATTESGDEIVGAVVWRAAFAQNIPEQDTMDMHIPVNACPGGVGEQRRITGLRVILKQRNNSKKVPVIKSIKFLQPDESRAWLPPLGILRDLQQFLDAVAANGAFKPETCATAQAVSLSLALASGSQACLMKSCASLLKGDAPDEWMRPLPTGLDKHVQGAVKTLCAERPKAVRKFLGTALQGGTPASTGEVDLRFDPAECQTTSGETSSLTLSNDDKTVHCSTSTNSLCVCDRGFASGRVTWVFHLDEDNANSECTCFGATTRPVTDRNYNSSHAFMYRAYNGQLYGTGNCGDTKEKIHPNDVVTVEWNADEGTLSFKVNDKDQGVCFKGLQGKELYPAVAFYSSSRKVSIVRCEVAGMAGAGSAHNDVDSMVKQAVEAMDAGEDAAAVLAATAAAVDETPAIALPPKPVKPVLQDEDNEEVQRELHPAIDMLSELGFHWVQAAAALRTTGDNVEQAAERLFSGEFSSDLADEVDSRANAHRRKMEQYHMEVSKWEAEKEAKEKEAAEKAAKKETAVAPPVTSPVPNKTFRIAAPTAYYDAVGAMLTYLCDLAGAFTPGLSSSKSGDLGSYQVLQPPVVQSQLAAISLEELFALQADAANMTELTTMLRRLLAASKLVDASIAQRHNELVILVLRLIRANLNRLVHAHVHPHDAGIITTGSKATLAPLHAILESLMNDDDMDSTIQQEAVRTVDTGLPVLYASAQQRADLLQSLIERNEKRTGTGRQDGPQAELLARCLRHFSSPSGVVSLLPPLARSVKGISVADQDAQVKEIVALLVQLFDVLGRESRLTLSKPGSEKAAATSLLEQGASLLASYQRHLLSLVLEEIESAEAEQLSGKLPAHAILTRDDAARYQLNAVDLVFADKDLLDVKLAGCSWSKRGNLSSLPACRVLSAYVAILVKFCGSILSAVQGELASRQVRPDVEASLIEKQLDIDSLLQNSVVGRLFPGFIGGLMPMASQPWLATAVLPLLAQLLPQLIEVQRQQVDLRRTHQNRATAIWRRQLLAQQGWWKDGAADTKKARVVEAQIFSRSNAGFVIPPPPLDGAPHFSEEAAKPTAGYVLWQGHVSIGGDHWPASVWLASSSAGKEKSSEVSGIGFAVLNGFSLSALLSRTGTLTNAPHLRAIGPIIVPVDVSGTQTPKDASYRFTMNLPIFEPSIADASHSLISGVQAVELFLSGSFQQGVFVGRSGLSELSVNAAAAALKPVAKSGKSPITSSPVTSMVGTAVLTSTAENAKETISKASNGYSAALDAAKRGEPAVTGGFCGVQTGLYAARYVQGAASHLAAADYWMSTLTTAVSMLAGRCASALVSGPMISFEEDELGPLLRADLFANGKPVGSSALAGHDLLSSVTGMQLDWPTAFSSVSTDGRSAQADSRSERPFSSNETTLKRLLEDTAETSGGTQLLNWLQKHHPEAPVRRKQGVFPEVELPLFLALTKHTGLVQHLEEVCTQLHTSPDSTPMSPRLSAVWREVLFVRSYLRKERSSYRDGARAAPEADASGAVEGDVQLQRKLKVTVPLTFDDLKAAMTSRALFLLELNPCSAVAVSATDVKPSTATLNRVLSSGMGLPTMAPSLAAHPSLDRTISRDAAALSNLQDKWSSTTAGLEQLLLRHSTSFEAHVGDRADDSGAAAHPGSRPKLGRQVSWRIVDGEGDHTEFTAAIEDMAAEAISDQSAVGKFELISKSIKAYVKYGVGGPPDLVQRILLWRDVRAAARTFALCALAHMLGELLKSVSPTSPILAVLAPLRAALQGQKEQYLQAASKSKETLDTDAWIERHSIGAHLDGASEGSIRQLCSAHAGLVERLNTIFSVGVSSRDVQLVSIAAWCLSIDLIPSDVEYLVHSAALRSMQNLLSLSRISSDAKDDGSNADWGKDYSWHPWHLVDVRAGLLQGRLSKLAVMQHILAAPDAVAKSLHKALEPENAVEWLLTNDVDISDIEATAERMAVEDVFQLYARFTVADTDWCTREAAQLPVASRFVFVPQDEHDRSEEEVATACERIAVEAALRSEEPNPDIDVAATLDVSSLDSKFLENKDAERRGRKMERVRGAKTHPKHEHELAADYDRSTSGYSCNSCRGQIAANGSVSWAHTACDWDCCSICYATRPAAEAWEGGPVADVVSAFASGGAARAVPAGPGRNFRVYADHDSSFKNVPSFMTNSSSRDYFWTIQTPRAGGATSRQTQALTVTVKAPVRIFVGIPKAMNDEAVSKIAWLKEDFVSTTYSTGDDRDGFRLFRSRYVVCPPQLLPPSVRNPAADATTATFSIRGLGFQSSANFIVILEEIPPALLDKLDFKLENQGAKNVGRMCVPIRRISVIKRVGWSLMKLLVAQLARSRDEAESADEAVEHLHSSKSEITEDHHRAAKRPVGRAAPQAEDAILRFVDGYMKELSDVLITSALPRNSQVTKLDFLEAENLAVTALQLILAIADLHFMKAYLSTEHALVLLLNLFRVGTPRLQRLTANILRLVATRIDPREFENALRVTWPLPVIQYWEDVASDVGMTGAAVAGFLFTLAAAPQVAANPYIVRDEDKLRTSHPEMHPAWVGALLGAHEWQCFGSAESLSAVASEVVALSRVLLSLAGWRPLLLPYVVAAVSEVGSVVGVDESANSLVAAVTDVDCTTATRLLGAFAILGGFVEPLRVGGRVTVAPFRFAAKGLDKPVVVESGSWSGGLTENIATVVSLRGTKAIVTYASDLYAPCTEVDAARLMPSALVAPPSGVVPLHDPVVQSLRSTVTAASDAKQPACFTPIFQVVIAALPHLLRGAAGIAAAVQNGMLEALYAIALRPAHAAKYVSSAAVSTAYRVLLHRCAESVSQSPSQILPDSTRTTAAEQAVVPSQSETSTKQALLIAEEAGVHFKTAAAVLSMAGGDVDVARRLVALWTTEADDEGLYQGAARFPSSDGKVDAVLIQVTTSHNESEVMQASIQLSALRAPASTFGAATPDAQALRVLSDTASASGLIVPLFSASLSSQTCEVSTAADTRIYAFELEGGSGKSLTLHLAKHGASGSVTFSADSLTDIAGLDDALRTNLAASAVQVHLVQEKLIPSPESDDAPIAKIDSKKSSTSADDLLLADADLVPPSATGHVAQNKKSASRVKAASPWTHVGLLQAPPSAFAPLVPLPTYLSFSSPSQHPLDVYRDSGFTMVEFLVAKHTPSSKFAVGVAEYAASVDQLIGSSASTWGYADDGRLGHAGEWKNWNSALKQGDRVRFVFDSGAGTLAVLVNDGMVGTAFTGLEGRILFPAVSMLNTNDEIAIIQSEPPGICFCRGQHMNRQLEFPAGEDAEPARIRVATSTSNSQCAIATSLVSPFAGVCESKLFAAVKEYTRSQLTESTLKILKDDCGLDHGAAMAIIARFEDVQAALEQKLVHDVIHKLGLPAEVKPTALATVGDGGRDAASTFRGKILSDTDVAVASNASHRFKLSRRFQLLKCAVGLGDMVIADGATVGEHFVELIGDGKQIWKSKPLHQLRQRMLCLVDVFGVHELTVKVTGPSDSSTRAILMDGQLFGMGARAIPEGCMVSLLPLNATTSASAPSPDLLFPKIGTYTGTLEVGDDGACFMEVALYDRERGFLHRRLVPCENVFRLREIYGVQLSPSPHASRQSICNALVDTASQMLVHGARLVLQQVIGGFVSISDQREGRVGAAADVDGVSAVVSDMPHFSLGLIGGAARLLTLVKLVAFGDSALRRQASTQSQGDSSTMSVKEFLMQESESTDIGASGDADGCGIPSVPTLVPWRNVLASVLHREKTDRALDRPVLRKTISKRSSSQRSGDHAPPADGPCLSDLLVQDCIKNFVRAVQHTPSQLHLTESSHPLPPCGVFTGSITLPDTSSLELYFDSQCALDPTRGEKLSFYSSPTFEPSSLLGTFAGTSECTPELPIRDWPTRPLLVSVSKVYWQLSCTNGEQQKPIRQLLDAADAAETFKHASDSWGFRIIARAPSTGWVKEADVLSGEVCSLNWSCWLLDFLLNRVSHVLKAGAVHNQKVLDALVSFLRSEGADSQTRSQVVALICQLLQRPDMFSDDLNLSKLDGVEMSVIKQAEKQLAAASSAKSLNGLPAALQDLIELVVARRAALRALENSRLAKLSGFNDTEQYPGRGVGVSISSRERILGMRPTSLNFAEIVTAFKAAYPETEALLAASLGLTPESAWAIDTNGNTSGFVSISGVEDAEERACLEVEWLLVHPEHEGLAVPEDAVLDFYDFMYQSCMQCAQNETTHSIGHESRMYLDRFRWLEGVRHRELGAPLIGDEPAETHHSEEPPRPPVSRVPKPWVAIAPSTPTTSHAVSIRIVRPASLACSIAASLQGHQPVSKLQSYALPSFAPSLRLTVLDFSSVVVTVEEPISTGQIIALENFDATKAENVASLRTLLEGVETVAVITAQHLSDGETALPADLLASHFALVVEDKDLAQLVTVVRSASSKLAKAPTAETPSSKPAITPVLAALHSPLAVAKAAAKLSRNRSRGTKPTAEVSHAASSLFASGTASTFAALPLKPELPAMPTKLIDQLQWAHDLTMAIRDGIRPADGILCCAWMEAIGENRYIETNHPYRSEELLAGDIHFEGATQLKVFMHPRCCTTPGVSLHLEYGAVVKTYSGNIEKAEDGRAKSNWPKEPITIPGSKLRYHFKAPAMSDGTNDWGVAFTVAPVWSTSARAAYLLKKRDEVVFASLHILSDWTPEMDAELTDIARVVCDEVNSRKLGGSSSDRYTMRTLPLSLLTILSQSMEINHSSLIDVPIAQLRMRFALIRLFNKVVQQSLACFSLASTRSWSVGHHLRTLSHCIFLEAKQGILEAALSSTSGSGANSIELSNFKATASEAKGHLDPDNSECMFAQAYKALRSTSSKELRGYRDSSQNKVFEIRFEGESGIDAGGVYREGLSRMTDDLFSDRFTLMVKCANAKKGYKINTDAYVPNSAWKTPLAVSMLEFAGRLMGLSLRTKACLPFTFPSIVWKAINSETRTFADLSSMDGVYAEFLESIRDCDRERVSLNGISQPVIRTEGEFAKAFPDLRFISFNCNGDEVELVPGGKAIPVTFANRLQFYEAALHFRLHEFDMQLAAIRRGFANLVPIRALSLFTWQEIEVLVSGKPDIDVDLLKRNTSYEGFSSSHKVIESFWRVFESFTQFERQQLIRFAWGRSRLPPEGSSWTTKFKITRLSGGDKALPMGHTCFSTIDLPEYSSDDVMAWGLRTAMNWGVGGILNG